MLHLKNVLTLEKIARIIADAIIINFSMLLAVMVHYLWLVTYYDNILSLPEVFYHHLQNYTLHGVGITVISLVVFFFSGFYSRGRAYQGRYKALLILQAVSLSYILFGFLAFIFTRTVTLPRSFLLLAWGMTALALIGSRLWSKLWRSVVYAERHLSIKRRSKSIKNVLVIGGAGYIGSALLPQLLNKGYKVRLLDLLLYGIEPIQNIVEHPKFEIIQADFRQVHQVVEAMEGMDAVIHLGAIVGDPACALDEELTIEINLMATRLIAEVAKANRVNRFIFASTCSVYGASEECLDEQSALNPVSLYARSKIASERVLQQMADEHFSPVLLRFGTIYGLSGRTRFDLVVNLLTAKAVMDGQITVFGGNQWRPFVHVNDAASAVHRALEVPLESVDRQVFNVGSDEQNYTIQQIGDIIHKHVPSAEMISKLEDTDRRNYQVSFSKIRRVLNFQPLWSVKQGIQQVIDAIQEGRIVDYHDAKYNNAKFLSEAGAYHLDRHSTWAYELLNEIQEQHEESLRASEDEDISKESLKDQLKQLVADGQVERAIALFHDHNFDEIPLAYRWYVKGALSDNYGKHRDALKYYMRALTAIKGVKNAEEHNYVFVRATLSVAVMKYKIGEDFEGAIRLLENLLSHHALQGDFTMEQQVMTTLAAMHYFNGKHSIVIGQLEKFVKSEPTPDHMSQNQSYLLLALAYIHLNSPGQAKLCFQQALFHFTHIPPSKLQNNNFLYGWMGCAPLTEELSRLAPTIVDQSFSEQIQRFQRLLTLYHEITQDQPVLLRESAEEMKQVSQQLNNSPSSKKYLNVANQ
ncbi:NAD(P)-dependent oxidoreductase [Deltaproteobacteria bacterium TL4]